jgi:hypothetical protein
LPCYNKQKGGGAMKDFCFTIDDNIRFLKELTEHNYKSIFAHPYLAMYKRLHEEFGLKVQLNLFYRTEGFDLSQMRSDYYAEWEQNSHWLKMSFHSDFENVRPYEFSGYDEVYEDCNKVHTQIIRFASPAALAKTTTIHYCLATEEGLKALADQRISGLLGLFGNNEKPGTSYGIPETNAEKIRNGETQEQGGQAGGMSICTDTYKADPRMILSYHVVPDCWLLQGGTTGGGGVMRWLEREFADYEREEGKRVGKSSLQLFNEIAEKVAPGSDGLVFLPYMSGERSPIWDPDAKGVFYGLDFSKTKGHFVRAAMEGVALSLKHNLDVAKEAGAEVSVLRAMGGSANSLLWTQIKSDVTGKPIVVPSSDTATTLGAAILAGVGVGMYKEFAEAVELTVENKRFHKPNEDNFEVYEKNYQIYLELYNQLKDTMKK